MFIKEKMLSEGENLMALFLIYNICLMSLNKKKTKTNKNKNGKTKKYLNKTKCKHIFRTSVEQKFWRYL